LEIVIDLKGLEIGASIKISFIKLPENVTPTITGRDFVIATVAAPTIMKEPEKPAEGTAVEGAEGAEATTDGAEGATPAAKDADTSKKDDKAAEKKPAEKK
jgi:large subunit ribosomal protein L25